jgi:hypothetical protein
MTGSGWTYLLFSGALVAVFIGIVAYYYNVRRRDRVEAPKYRMLEDDGEPRRHGKGR